MGIWAHPYAVRPVQVGEGFFLVDLSPSDVVMSQLRLQQASDCIPHPYRDLYKVFCHLDLV
jgi:hypothetical protein